MHVLIPAADGSDHLRAEWKRAFGVTAPEAAESAGGLLIVENPTEPAAPLPPLAFARQVLPEARPVAAASIKGFADLLFDAVVSTLPEGAPWRLLVGARYEPAGTDAGAGTGTGTGTGTGAGAGAGSQRCRLIHDSLRDRLKRQRRHLLRHLAVEPRPFAKADSVVQLLLTEPDRGFLSMSPAPIPFEQRAVMSPFSLGEIPIASDQAAPSRAFAKLVEAEQRLGMAITRGELCVDLGASPGSWTYVALERGARVIAVDRSPLRADLHRRPGLRFHEGDAFRFVPETPVDWLLCDVIAAPERSIALALDWVRQRRCRRFVVTIKFKGVDDYPQLDTLKRDLPPHCTEWRLTRLCANKNEACVMGRVRD